MSARRLLRVATPDLRVRAEQRIIDGIAVPYNVPTEIHDREGTYWEQFAPGAFSRTIAERGPGRVKVLIGHDMAALPVGRAETLTETSGGLAASLRIANTPEGDQALSLAADGILDGLSVSFSPINSTRQGEIVTRTEVKLHEISLTGFPAYDSARVAAVRSHQPSTDPRVKARATATLAVVAAGNARLDERLLMDPNTRIPDQAEYTFRRAAVDSAAAALSRALENGADPDTLSALTRELEDADVAAMGTVRTTSAPPSGSPMAERAARIAEEGRLLAAVYGGEDRVHVVGQGRTYQPGLAHHDDNSPDFLTDLYRAQLLNDSGAHERLARHGREVQDHHPELYRRAVASGGVAAFVPPDFLVEAWAEYARAGRPCANLVTRLPLPETGMTVSIPKVSTPTSTGVQTAENAAVAATDPASTTLSVPVATIAGNVDISRQALERGELLQSVLTGDLASDYAARLDAQIIAGTGADGQHKGILNTSSINAVTYTDASPTLAELWPKLASAVGQVVGQRFRGPTAMLMHPLTWAWILSTLDAEGRPLVVPDGSDPTSAPGKAGTVDYIANNRVLFGTPVVLDGNMPTNLGSGTNETRIIVADFADCLLLEDPAPTQARFDAPGSGTLTVRLSLWGYSAFTAARQPHAVSVIAGTGLVTPSL